MDETRIKQGSIYPHPVEAWLLVDPGIEYSDFLFCIPTFFSKRKFRHLQNNPLKAIAVNTLF